MPPHGYPGILRPGDRIFFIDPKHDIARHGLPTCFALTVKIRLRTLSRSVSCAGRRCIIFPPALAKLACTESRITDIRHCCVRRVEPLSFLLLLLLPFPWSIPALQYDGKNTPQFNRFTRTPARKFCGILTSSNWCSKKIYRTHSENGDVFLVNREFKRGLNLRQM